MLDESLYVYMYIYICIMCVCWKTVAVAKLYAGFGHSRDLMSTEKQKKIYQKHIADT